MRLEQFFVKLIIGIFVLGINSCKEEKIDLPPVPPVPLQSSDLRIPLAVIDKLEKGSEKPNLIFILTDDLGYWDTGFNGNKEIITPHLDDIANSGIVLDKMYAGSSVCSPSRACVLTGRFPLRFGHSRHFFDDNKDYLPDSVLTLADIFKANGYVTSHIGKWHLGGLQSSDALARLKGDSTTPGPKEAGFDHYFSQFEEKETRWMLHHIKQVYRQGWKYTLRNDSLAKLDSVHHSLLKIEEAIGVMEECKNSSVPFFINLSLELPHKPYEPVLGEAYDLYTKKGLRGEHLDAWSMVTQIDLCMGKLLKYLDASGLDENTLLIFTSDNGPDLKASYGPFLGGKYSLTEGGLRVPFVFFGPGMKLDAKLRNIKSYDSRFHFVDIIPTLVDLFGLKNFDSLNLDGISIAKNHLKTRSFPFVLSKKTYHNVDNKPPFISNQAIISGDQKLIMDDGKAVAFYNLKSDPFEKNNLLKEGQEEWIGLKALFLGYMQGKF